MAALRRALPGLERWERPTSAPCRFSSFQPGRLAQGPEENSGRAGRMAGLAGVVMEYLPSLQMSSPPLGGRGPARYLHQTRLLATPNFGCGGKKRCRAPVTKMNRKLPR